METNLSSHSNKVNLESYWDCSVCTFTNKPEAFKCGMCDVRKGTSTRKPKLNQQMVAQQVAQKFAPAMMNSRKLNGRKISRKTRPRLKNVDRNSAEEITVTVGNITVTITDYKVLPSDSIVTLSDSLTQSASNNSLDSSPASSEATVEN